METCQDLLPNEKFALECRARYEAMGLVVDEKNGEFAHCPYPRGMGDAGYYLLHEDHQHQGLLQSKDVGRCCFWVGNVKNWLITCDPIPAGYFDLCDIYDEYASKQARQAVQKLNQIMHSEKDERGCSRHATRCALKMNEKLHAKKDERGRSVSAVKSAQKLNSQVWQSTVDGFKGKANIVAIHNKSNGWDPGARIRIL